MDVDRPSRGTNGDSYTPGGSGAAAAPGGALHGRGRFAAPRQEWEKSVGGPMNAPAEEAEAHAKVSKRENRLYIGNLAYDCNYRDLEGFMKQGGSGFGFSLGLGLDLVLGLEVGWCLDSKVREAIRSKTRWLVDSGTGA